MKEKLQHLLLHKTHSKIQYFLLIVLVAFLLAGILWAIMINTDGLYQQIEENTINYASDVSSQLSSRIASRMHMQKTYICNLADTLSSMKTDDISDDLLYRKAEYLELDKIFIINADGSTIPADSDYSDILDYLAQAQNLYQNPQIFTCNNKVFFSSPINADNGNNSLLIGMRTQSALKRMLHETNFKEQGISCIVDSHGTVIVSATEDLPFQSLIDIFHYDSDSSIKDEVQNVIHDINAHRSGIAQFESINKEPVMLGYQFLGINDWILLTLVPSNMFSRGTETFMTRYSLIVAISALIMLILILSIVRFYRYSLKHIKDVALTDPLTGGINFLAFKMECSSILENHPMRNYAIVYLNIRNFKHFNERFGVTYGDSMLQAVYTVFKNSLKENELMTRSSGDHFYFMLNCLDTQEVQLRLNEIFHNLKTHLNKKFALTQANFSQGAYLIREKSLEFLVLTDRAKIASLYQKVTQECQFYDDILGKKIEQEHILEDAFQRAIQNHEFQLYIQPKIRPGEKKPSSGEVLVRWQYPDYGIIYPGDFIPLFERSGKICDLDFYIFEETCKLLKKWLTKGTAIPLSVNLSRAHLVSSNLSFLDRFKSIKEQYEIPDNLIELELTESLMLERREISLVSAMIDKIREMGMLCSIDDFGFGNSSLTMLKDLNVTTVKMDRQFFLCENKKSWMVIQQLTQLAHDLGMTVVAEGIEDYKQVEQLYLCGCDLIQGYVYAKPMPIPQFENWSDIVDRPQLKQLSILRDNNFSHKEYAFSKPADIICQCEKKDYKNLLTVALKAAKVCIYELDLTQQLCTFLENSEAIFGIPEAKILHAIQPYSALPPQQYQNAIFSHFSHPDDIEAVSAAYDRVLDGHSVSYTTRIRAKDSQYIWCKVNMSPVIKNDRPVQIIGTISDISDAHHQKEQLELKANLDTFTELWNKAASINLIRKALRKKSSRHHALLLIDIDNFKHFNDTYGHLNGDKIILTTAHHLKNIFGNKCTIGRFGGDEFIVFVPNVSDLNTLTSQARNVTKVNYEDYFSTNSVGIALYPDHGITFEELFKQADRALYRAKKKRCEIAFASYTTLENKGYPHP